MHIVEDTEEDIALAQWSEGGSALPLVKLYADRGELDHAAAVARLALERDHCPDAEAIEEILDSAGDPPPDWKLHLDDFAEAPSLERWRDLMRFVPDHALYQRQRNAIRYLNRRGVDGDMLFLCAADLAVTPDAIELVEDGRVHVDTVLERGRRSPSRTTFAGLAAQAAFLTGDLLGTIRLLRDAIEHETELCPATPHIAFIRVRASESEHAALDHSRIPRWRKGED